MLIADDARHNRMLLGKIFGDEYDIVEARNGVEALEKLRELPEVTVLVLDIVMPDMDGFAVLEEMRKDARLREIPTVVATARDDVDTQIKALNSGATDVMVKPINPQIILHRVRNIVARKEADRLAEYNRAIELELRLTDFDEKTGCYNKHAFIRYATRLIKQNPDRHLVLLRWDIDHFKVYNDFFGVDVGDMFLRSVGEFYRDYSDRTPGLLLYARYDADHFVSLWDGDLFNAENTAALIKTTLDTRKTVSFEYTPRIGLYRIEGPVIDVALMCDRALLALRSTKYHFGKFYAWYDDAMREELIEEQEIVNEMQAALDDGQFCAYLQPQYNHADGSLIGAEALVRWLHPEKGVIAPDKFIPLFERTGFIFEMDKYIWEQACQLLRKWIDEGIEPLPLSVNVSRYDIFLDDFYQTVTGLVEKYDLPDGLLRLEITESAFVNPTEQIVDVVEKLSKYSFLIEIDDFGSGYSSFNTLKDVPAHILKLDMRFLENTKNSQRGGNILESIIRMAKWLNMPVIAEGVETLEQADFLRSIGCMYMQGYLYAKPMPVGEFEELMRVKGKQPALNKLETIANLDNNAFWDPRSMETMVFNRYSGGACVFEYCDGNVEMLRVNEKYAGAFNTRMDDERLFTKDPFETLGDKERAAVLAVIDGAAASGKEESFEIFARGDHGEESDEYIRFTIRMIARNNDRSLFYAYIENVTAQRLADKRIQTVSKQMQTIIDNLDGGIVAIALDENGQFSHVFSNDRLYTMFGYDRSQFAKPDEVHINVVHPQDRLYVSDMIYSLFKTSEPTSFDCRAIKRDSSVIFVRCNATVTTLDTMPDSLVALLVITDATAEREADEQFRIVAVQSGRNVFRYDILTGESYHSKQSEDGRIYQEVYKDAVQNAIASGMIDEGSVEDYLAFFTNLRNGVSPLTADIRVVLPDGRRRWYRYTATSLFNENGRPETAVISSYDCSGERERERAYAKWRNEVAVMMESGGVIYEWELSHDVCESVSNESDEPIPRNTGFNAAMYTYAETCVYSDDKQAFLTMMSRSRLMDCYADGNYQDAIEYRRVDVERGTRWIHLTVQLVSGHNVGDIRCYMVFRDVTEKKLAELKILARAETDALTGALNRGTFVERATALLEKEDKAMHAFLMIDVDGFKQVNDTLGHNAGDQALTQLISAARSRLRATDLIGRIGGDEFVIMLRNIPDANIAEIKVRQLSAALRRRLSDDVEISVSIGATLFPDDGKTFDEMYKRADIALYQAKESGKDCFCFYNTLVIDEDGKVRFINTQKGWRVSTSGRTERNLLLIGGTGQDYADIEKWLGRDYNVRQTGDYRQAFVQMRRMRLGLSVVALDMSLPRGDAFEMLRRLAGDPLSAMPVIALIDKSNDAMAPRALAAGALDFVIRPFDQTTFETRVQGVLARSENEQARIDNCLRIRQQEDEDRYIDLLRATGIASVSIDWINNIYTYSPQIEEVLSGRYDDRALWQVLLSDHVAKSRDVKAMQRMVYDLANDHGLEYSDMNVRLKNREGVRTWYRFYVRKLSTMNGVAVKLLVILQDVDDVMKLRMQLEENAKLDTLTGLYSREGFFEQAQQWIAAQPPATYCLIAFDIDNFLSINALSGGAAGDDALRAVGECVKARVGQKGLCGRVAADAFAVLCPYDGHAQNIVFDTQVSAQSRLPSGVAVSLCAGCYLVTDVLAPVSMMYEWAHLAKNSVKGKDHPRFAYYDETMHEALLRART